jgi:TfoX/Sxy family transcriptional regulator of competence genes
MNANETGHDRVRALLEHDPRIVETKMFGGVGFMLNGNMAVGFTKKGELMVRLGEDGEAQAAGLPGADTVDYAHRMGGMLFVSEHAVGDDLDLKRWVDLALRHVETLPPR